MSFTMNDIKINKKPIKKELSDFGKIINEKKILTSNVKLALFEYVKFRLFKIRHSSFTPDKFSLMIDDLIVYILNKSIEDVNLMDVKINENEFIFEIANAIYYCNIHNLYYKKDLKAILEKELEKGPKRLARNEELGNKELEEYFKSIMV